MHKHDAVSSLRRVSNNNKRNSNSAAAFKRPTEVVAIYGNGGVGKSTLVRNLQQFARDYGYIAIAKFDHRNPTPYGCILRCLSIFLRNILTESVSELDRFSQMLKDQLGPQAIAQLPTLLLDNVPELRTVLGENSLAACSMDIETGGNENRTRFHSTFKEIFLVMAQFKFLTLVSEEGA